MMNRPKSASSPPVVDDLIPFTLIYIGIGTLMLSLRFWAGSPLWLEYLVKPLIMPALLGFSWWKGNQRDRFRQYWLSGAILASWSGDICLMFEGNGWFLAGLGSFLMAHICYVVLFQRIHRHVDRPALLSTRPWLGAPWLLYGAGLLWLILPDAGGLRLPVVIYAGVILIMALAALNRWDKVSPNSFGHVFLGAQLFLLSDSLIAVGKFLGEAFPVTYLSAWIMLTYMAAQYLIVVGLLLEPVGE
ncbi:MAG: lysoplasmalogenase [Bacteroidota bacterium]